MAKPLSQEEIDILLEVRSQLSESDDYDLAQLESMVAADAERRINPYNFKRPRLFAQDQMRVLNHVHEAFARDLSVYLSAQLRTIVDINLTAVDQVLYSEYVMSSAPPSALYVVEVEELVQKIVFELDPRLVIFTIEKLFGGPGVFNRDWVLLIWAVGVLVGQLQGTVLLLLALRGQVSGGQVWAWLATICAFVMPSAVMRLLPRSA